MHSIVLHCPHLGRDLSQLHEVVPDLGILIGDPTERGEDGCLQMHHAVVSWARACRLDRVFVLEDDCEFTPSFVFKKWCADADWAQRNDYDVMVGGCTRTYDEKLVREGMIEVSAFHSAHCVVYFESGFEKVLQTVQPFDLSVGQVGCRVVMTYPFVAVQRPSYSGILKKSVDYVPFYHQHEQELRRKLRINA